MLATMVDWSDYQKNTGWNALSSPPKKEIWTKMQMIQNLISGILFLKIFWTYNFFIFVHMFQSISEFFYFRFSSKKSQSQQKMTKKRPLILHDSFAKKKLILWTSTHLILKIICSSNTTKNLSDLTDFPANMFLFGVRQKHLHFTISWRPRTAFLKHFERKCLHISVYFRKNIFVPEI